MALNGREFQPITTATIPDSFDFDHFAARSLGKVNPNSHGRIAYAFSTTVGAHKDQPPRDTGEPYFAHPLMCTIYLAELDFKTPPLFMATLLHDVQEDNLEYLIRAEDRLEEVKDLERAANPHLTDDEYWDQYWREDDEFGKSEFIRREFGDATADIVDAVSKKPTKGLSQKAKINAELRYIQQLKKGPKGAWIVKGVDRLHNLRTMPPRDPGRIERKIVETREGYLPIFEMGARAYPGPGERLLWLIECELEKLEAGLEQQTPL